MIRSFRVKSTVCGKCYLKMSGHKEKKARPASGRASNQNLSPFFVWGIVCGPRKANKPAYKTPSDSAIFYKLIYLQMFEEREKERLKKTKKLKLLGGGGGLLASLVVFVPCALGD